METTAEQDEAQKREPRHWRKEGTKQPKRATVTDFLASCEAKDALQVAPIPRHLSLYSPKLSSALWQVVTEEGDEVFMMARETGDEPRRTTAASMEADGSREEEDRAQFWADDAELSNGVNLFVQVAQEEEDGDMEATKQHTRNIWKDFIVGGLSIDQKRKRSDAAGPLRGRSVSGYPLPSPQLDLPG